MQDPGSLVARLEQREMLKAEETLVMAFLRDPMTSFLFGREPGFRAKLRWIFRIELRYALKHGVVDAAEGAKAVAIWIPPGETSGTAINLLRTGALTAPFVLGWRPTWRIVRLLRGMHRLHRRLQQADHWYLLALAIHPKRQSKGWGSLILNHGLQRARAQGLTCYLETTNPANVKYYETHGFRLAGRGSLNGSDLSLSAMVSGAS